MRGRLLALSLSFTFAFPPLSGSFRLPFSPWNSITSIISTPTTSTELAENVSESYVNLSEEAKEEFVEKADELNKEPMPPIKEWIPYNIQEETLTHFKAQNVTGNPNGYTCMVNMEGTSNYDTFKGISTFRGNNYRQNAFYGKVNIFEKKLTKAWTAAIGSTDNWTGVGWNGQPAIIQWDEYVKDQMNLYDEFKQKENFTEIIYGALDSTIHFYDLESGLPSRPSIQVPSSIKGSVTIDPRGYPLLYVGQGIDKVHGSYVKFGYHIFSLITGEELYFINGRDQFAYLSWAAFDGNPIIDGKTDTIILPGENGLLYVLDLNTNYDKENGTISIHPYVSKYRYTQNGRAGGMENAVTIYKNYAYFGNNNGVVQCLDLSSLTPIWSYQMEDDIDATIGLEEESGEIFLYVGCEVDKRGKASPAHVKKLNGRTGEVIWDYSCVCQLDADVNGGVLSSPVIGQNEIDNMVIFNFSKVTNLRDGKMVALDKITGEVIWEKNLDFYTWSSPVAIYTENGESYLVFCDSIGVVHLINPHTGETITTLQTGGGNIEGSPAIFDNHIVIGTRGQRIYRIDIQ